MKYGIQDPLPQIPRQVNTLPETSVMENVVSSFFNLLNSQEQDIKGIESKMHNILNRQVPEKELACQPQAEPRDFKERIQFEINKLEQHNSRLERIYKHLSEIV